jgi:putative membrane protein
MLGHWSEYSHGWGAGISMVLFWLLLIAASVLLGKFIWSSSIFPVHEHEKTALEILKERYARGEIGRDEFTQKKRDLGG